MPFARRIAGLLLLAMTACTGGLNKKPTEATRSSITGTGPVEADGVEFSNITIQLIDGDDVALVGVVPTFDATDTENRNSYGGCSVSNSSGVSLCTLRSTKDETKVLRITSPLVLKGGSVRFVYGAARKMNILTQPSTTAVAGVGLAQSPSLELLDNLGNRVLTATTAVTLSAYTDPNCTTPGSGTLTATTNPVTPTSGIVTFSNVAYTKIGNVYFKASGASLTSSCTEAVNITHAVANKIAFKTSPSTTATAGANLASQPEIEIQDTYGNRVSTGAAATSSVTLSAFTNATCTTASATSFSAQTNPLTATAGWATFSNVKTTLAQTTYIKAAVSGYAALCSAAITVSPNVPSTTTSTITGTGPVAANGYHSSSVTIHLGDQYSNSISGVTPTFSATNTGSGNTYACGATNTSGNATCTLKSTQYETKTLQITSPITLTGGSVIFLRPPDTTQTTFTATSPVTANGTSTSNLSIRLLDDLGNPVVGLTPVFTATGTGNTLSACSATNASGDSTCTLKSTKAESKTLALNNPMIMSGPTVIFEHGAAAKVVYKTQPSTTGTAGSNLSQSPIIEIQDAQGNKVSDGVGSDLDITLSAFTNNTCTAPATGTLSATHNPETAVAGTATFTSMTFSKSGTYYFKAAASGVTSACSTAVTFSAGSSNLLAFTIQPSSTAQKTHSFTTSPSVEVTDAFGNRTTSGGGANLSISLSAYTDPSCTSAAGGSLTADTNPKSATTGLVSFTGVKYSLAETIYLKASGSGVTSTCSSPIEVSNWRALTTTAAPSARSDAGSVWTGSELIVWGGKNSSNTPLASGARYSTTTETWTATPTTGAAPSARYAHATHWTGTEMLIWGGEDGSQYLADGARFNPTTQTWTAISATGAPSARSHFSSFWNGSLMYIFGGRDALGYLDDLYQYNPATDQWTALSAHLNYPRSSALSSWDSSTNLWYFLGGTDGNGNLSDGFAVDLGSGVVTAFSPDPSLGLIKDGTALTYFKNQKLWVDGQSAFLAFDPTLNQWFSPNTANEPARPHDHRFHTWTANGLWIFGGDNGSTATSSGAFYHAGNDAWTTLSSDLSSPNARTNGVTEWTGTEVLIWGGCTDGPSCSTQTNTGYSYRP